MNDNFVEFLKMVIFYFVWRANNIYSALLYMMMLYTHLIVGVDANLVLTNLSTYFLLYTSTIKIIVNLLS